MKQSYQKLVLLIIGGGLLILLIMVLTKTASPLPCRGCNIILISIDTLGAKHLGVYGNDEPTSPFLDRLAKERGIVFVNAIAQSSWTLPSHAAMLTSHYPGELGIWTPNDALGVETKTIAQVLKQHGFTTQAFSNGAFVQPEWGFDRGFDSFSGSLELKKWDDAPQIFIEAARWLQQKPKQPFFLFIHPFHVHDPYTPGEEVMTQLGKEKAGEAHISDIVRLNTKSGGPTREDANFLQTAYHGEIRELDTALENFFKEIDALNLKEDTVIIITADHGEEFGEHGTVGFHVALYNETIQVPLVVFIPKAKPKKVDGVVELRSIPPTILELLGLPQDPAFKSSSLLSLLAQEEEIDEVALSVSGVDRSWVFQMDENRRSTIEKAYETLESFGKTRFPKPRHEEWNQTFSSSARSREWHLISNKDGSFELYNLKTDRGEQINLFPSWSKLAAEDRKEALKVIQKLGVDVPIPCGIYCPSEE